MSTSVNSPQGRHRAPARSRAMWSPTTVAAVVAVAVVVALLLLLLQLREGGL